MRRWVAPLIVSFLVLTACAPAAAPAAPAAPAERAPAAAPAAQPAAQAAPAAPAAKQQVSVRLGWVMKGEYAFLLLGKEAGIFDKHGLDVEIGEGKGSTAAMQAVAQKQDTFGYTGGSGYLLARSKDMPIKMTAVMLQKGPQVLLSYPDSPVRTPKDLEGKSMVLSPGEAFSSLWPSFAAGNGVDRAKVREVNVAIESRPQVFLQKQAQVLPDFVTATAYLVEEKAGVELVKFYPADIGWDAISNGIFAHEDTIRDKPDLVRRFTAAAVEAFDYTAKNLDQATELMVPKLGGQSAPVVKAQIEAAAGLAHTARTVGKPTGWTDPEDWKDSLNMMTAGGDLAPQDVKAPEYYFTNEFLPAQ